MVRTSGFDGTGSVNQNTDPFEQLEAFIIQYLSSQRFTRNMGGVMITSVDWKETEKEHVIKVDLPGVKQEDILVTVEGSTLAISGQRSKEQVQKMERWHSAERSTGPFIRKFTLPENAVLDRVTANEANGVLTVIVPKLVARGSQPRRIELGTSGGAENRPGSSTSGACDRTH